MQHSTLNELYRESADDLLSAYGIKGHFLPHQTDLSEALDKPFYLSVLGATGQDIALASILKLDRDLLTALYPLNGAAEHDLQDWCRELNNQLVGRMKNKLLRYGVVVTLGLPVLFASTDVRAISSADITFTRYSIELENGGFSLSLETFIPHEFEVHACESPIDCEEALIEGSVALF